MERKVELPSGAVLRIFPAPFSEAKALYKALLSEGKGLKLNPKDEVDVNFFKDIFCTALSSDLVEEKLWVCMERCLYDGEKLTPECFEPVERRDDYFTCMYEITKENVFPFTKSLYAEFSHIFDLVMKSNPE
jgi:hypothetical protein